MRLDKKFISIAIAVFLAGFLFVSCANEPPPPLRVGIVVWTGTESLFLARSLGYYDNTPIKLLDYPSDSEMMRAYRNGDLEAATITLDEVLQLAETDPDVRIVTIQDFSNGGDAIVGNSKIKKLQDLKGQRIGVETTASGGFELIRALEQVGLSPKDVQIVTLLTSEQERAFKEGSIDAVVTFEPTVSKLLSTGGNLLWDSKKIFGEVLDVVAMRETVIVKQSVAARVLTNGWFQALHYLQKNPQDAARRIAPHSDVTPAEFLKSLKSICIPDVQENQDILGKRNAISLSLAKRVAKYLLDKKLLTKAIDPSSIFDDRLVHDIKISTFMKR